MTLKVIAGNESPLDSSRGNRGKSLYWKVTSFLGSEGMEVEAQDESHSKGQGHV